MSDTMRRPLPRFQWMCKCGTVVSMKHSSCYACQRPRRMDAEPAAEATLGNALAGRASLARNR